MKADNDWEFSRHGWLVGVIGLVIGIVLFRLLWWG